MFLNFFFRDFLLAARGGRSHTARDIVIHTPTERIVKCETKKYLECDKKIGENVEKCEETFVFIVTFIRTVADARKINKTYTRNYQIQLESIKRKHVMYAKIKKQTIVRSSGPVLFKFILKKSHRADFDKKSFRN